MSEVQVDAIRAQIAAANERFAVAVSGGDKNVLRGLFTEDAMLLPPHRQSVSGREHVVDFWANVASNPHVSIESTFTTLELSAWDDVACEIGTARIVAASHGQEKLLDVGKYLVIWKKIDGAWKMHRDIFNSDLPIKQ
jgi:ketosteroid isomerase-like protein